MNNFINKQKVLNRILEIIMIWVKNFKSVYSPSYIKSVNALHTPFKTPLSTAL